MRLTKRVIDGLGPRDKDFFAWDAELRGFGVRVWPSGGKTYVAQYRAAGRTRRYKIADHGHVTVEQARQEARAILGEVARGSDPAEERATRRKSLTVADLCDRYLKAADAGLIQGRSGLAKKASTLIIDRGRIARHILPLIGNRLVIDLTPADINRFVRDVTTGKSAVTAKTVKGRIAVAGGAGTAARTVGLLGGILTFAVSEGIRPDNPARGVKRRPDARRTRRVSGAEYAALGRVLAEADDARDAWQGVVGLRLLALTGCRKGEVEGLRWAEVDLEGQALRLADSKTGASVRPLGRAAADLLRALPRDGEFVLPAARRSKHFRGLAGAVDRYTKRLGIEGITAHTLRHGYGSVAGDLGYSELTIGALLGHAGGSVTSRYVHHLDAVLVSAADRVANAVAGMMAG